MKRYVLSLLILLVTFTQANARKKQGYTIYFGNTHAHSIYSGDIWVSAAKQGKEPDAKNTVENHFSLAKKNGYDFYCITDHSQYPQFNAVSWDDTKAKADAFTDAGFVALCGYEHSDNDGPDGRGHMNVYGTADWLNALAEGVSIEYLHNWLAQSGQKDAVVCFNHPQQDAYNDFYCYNESARLHITLMELINGTNPRFYPTFLNALSKGWKVSPVAGCDNHGWQGIEKWTARTGMLAEALTPGALLEAMAARRTYASLDRNLEVAYSVNGKIMGSDIEQAEKYEFVIDISDPDIQEVSNAITKVEIIGNGGKLLVSKDFDSHIVEWKVTLPADGEKYYFVLIYSAMTGDKPVAYAAPVWIL